MGLHTQGRPSMPARSPPVRVAHFSRKLVWNRSGLLPVPPQRRFNCSLRMVAACPDWTESSSSRHGRFGIRTAAISDSPKYSNSIDVSCEPCSLSCMRRSPGTSKHGSMSMKAISIRSAAAAPFSPPSRAACGEFLVACPKMHGCGPQARGPRLVVVRRSRNVNHAVEASAQRAVKVGTSMS